MRAKGPIEFAAIDVFRTICCNKMRKEWDPHCDNIHFMAKVGVNAFHCYNRSKRVLIVDGREFLLDFFFN